MENSNHRKSIIRNTIWGNANIVIRYLSSFIATALIARNYSPEDFGFYQLILTYIGILETLNFLNSNHLRNHLLESPEDEIAVAGIWYYQSIGIWIITSFVILVSAYFSADRIFWYLLLIANLKFLFRAYDYVQIIADHRMRNDLTQQIQIFNLGFFNSIRIVFSSLKCSLFFLVLSSIFQGIFSTCHQIFLKRKLNFKFEKKFDSKKYFQLVKQGGFLTLVYFLSGFQSRFVSAIVAEKMSSKVFGNFQLIVKLVEPATAIGLIVITVNYTLLINTLKFNRRAFFYRYLKISLLSLSLALACSLLISVFPSDVFIRIFGNSYEEAIDGLIWGSGIVISSTILAISTQLDAILRKYSHTVIKFLLILIIYLTYFSLMPNLSLKKILFAQSLMPILVVLVVDAFFYVVNFNTKK